jgi:hypothetical protein
MSDDRISKLIEELFPTEVPAPSASNSLTLKNHDSHPLPAIAARQDLFVESLEAGWSEARARKAAGISHAVLEQWKRDPSFLARYNDAYKDGTGYLEDLAFLRAHTSDQVLLKLLESRDPAKYRPRAGGGSGDVNVIINNLFDGEPPQQTKVIVNGESDAD